MELTESTWTLESSIRKLAGDGPVPDSVMEVMQRLKDVPQDAQETMER